MLSISSRRRNWLIQHRKKVLLVACVLMFMNMGIGYASQPAQLILETKFLCGTQTEIKEFDHIYSLEEWVQSEGDHWQVIQKTGNEYRLVREVTDDLAPVCKNEGYFGLSEDGWLNIYQGPPHENQVIETFFQIDMGKLEIKLPSQELVHLQEGIRIQNVAEYLSVLSTYGEFAADK